MLCIQRVEKKTLAELEISNSRWEDLDVALAQAVVAVVTGPMLTNLFLYQIERSRLVKPCTAALRCCKPCRARAGVCVLRVYERRRRPRRQANDDEWNELASMLRRGSRDRAVELAPAVAEPTRAWTECTTTTNE